MSVKRFRELYPELFNRKGLYSVVQVIEQEHIDPEQKPREKRVRQNSKQSVTSSRETNNLPSSVIKRPAMGDLRSNVPVFGHVATDNKHGNYRSNFPDGVSNSELPK